MKLTDLKPMSKKSSPLIRVSKEVHEKLRSLSYHTRMNISFIASEILNQYLDSIEIVETDKGAEVRTKNEENKA